MNRGKGSFMARPAAVAVFAVMALAGYGLGGDNNVSGGTTSAGGGGDKKYRAVKIGNQTWMAKNLDIETPNSWCYDNNPDNCAKYGRLYTWDAAMKACPAGWHLPDRKEWSELVRFAGGDSAGIKLKAGPPEWNGTNEYGFSALPGGGRYTGMSFDDLSSWGNWWTADEESAFKAYRRNMLTRNAYVVEYHYQKGFGFSVRCVRD
jgi:uncharacterized protein (TIGR02145 family)